MTPRFEIQNFPQCLINPKLKKEIIGDIYNKHDFTFSYDGQVIISVRGYGTEFGFGCRTDYVYLEMDKAKVLKSIGIDIQPIPFMNYIAMNDEQRKEFKQIEIQWYLMNK